MFMLIEWHSEYITLSITTLYVNKMAGSHFSRYTVYGMKVSSPHHSPAGHLRNPAQDRRSPGTTGRVCTSNSHAALSSWKRHRCQSRDPEGGAPLKWGNEKCTKQGFHSKHSPPCTDLDGKIPGNIDVPLVIVHPDLGYPQCIPLHGDAEVKHVGFVGSLNVGDLGAWDHLYAAPTQPHL